MSFATEFDFFSPLSWGGEGGGRGDVSFLSLKLLLEFFNDEVFWFDKLFTPENLNRKPQVWIDNIASIGLIKTFFFSGTALCYIPEAASATVQCNTPGTISTSSYSFDFTVPEAAADNTGQLGYKLSYNQVPCGSTVAPLTAG